MTEIRPFTFPSTIGLSEGVISPDVEKLQDFLQHFGYLRIASANEEFSAVRTAANPPDANLGNFDEATAKALRDFQQFHGLPVTGVLDEATVVQMSLPRCGFPDIPTQQGVSDFVAQGNKWNKTDLTYGFQEFTPELTQQQVRDAIAAALNLWSQVTPLRFTEVPLASNPDFVIRFVAGDHGDGSPFDGVGRVLAHAFYPPPNGGAIAGDAHFDEAETWTVNIPVPAGGFDLITVAAHEFGHSLGLAHSSVAGALMFPSYSGPRRFLAQDDIDGIRSIYGARFPNWQLLDNNPASVDIVADGNNLYQLHNSGRIWKFTGTPLTGWLELDNNSATKKIVAGGGNLYQIHKTGLIWKFTGTPFTGWQLLDNNPASVNIISASNNLYQIHNNGFIWKFTG